MATQRKWRNFIKGIRDGDGVWHYDEGAVSKIFVDFYTNLFSSSNVYDLDRVLEGVKRVVTDNMNVELTKPYSRGEVDAAINWPLRRLRVLTGCLLFFISPSGRMWGPMSLML